MNKSAIGKAIAGKRRELGMTQRELAGNLGVSNKAVSKWETGRGLPDAAMIPAIAGELGMSADELFGMEAPRASEQQPPLGQRIRVALAAVLKALIPLAIAVAVWPLLARTPLNITAALWGTQYPLLFLLALTATSYTLVAAWHAESSLPRPARIVLAAGASLALDALPLLVVALPIATRFAVVLDGAIYALWAIAACALFLNM